MQFLSRDHVLRVIEDAITNKKMLRMTYQRVTKDRQIVTRVKAPFDVGTTNLQKMESHKDNLYAFCFDHVDPKTGQSKPMVHPINIEHVISIEDTNQIFNENGLADINKANTGYDYRECKFAIVPDRGWFTTTQLGLAA